MSVREASLRQPLVEEDWTASSHDPGEIPCQAYSQSEKRRRKERKRRVENLTKECEDSIGEI